MAIKSGFGKAGNMNGPRNSKTADGATKSGFGKAGTGSKSAANKGYSGGRGNRVGAKR